MPKPRHRGSKDKNHDELASVFRMAGCDVLDLHDTGIPGMPDVAVGCVGVWHLVEFKNPLTYYGRKGFSQDQSTFARDTRGEKPWLASTPDECLALVNNWRRACRT